MMPILKAGKDSYVEWPLASNLKDAEEMLNAAKQSDAKTMAGLQARNSPVTLKIKELVESGTIGELLSSEMQIYSGFLGSDTEPPGIDYLAKKEVGGNLFTIMFSHSADPAFFALGDVDEVSATLMTRYKQTKLLKADGSFDKMISRETPDQVMVNATLKGSGAPITIYQRGGKQFKDAPPLNWQLKH
jgi:predicted dehydrogenase